jgi:hypothetical protein
VGGLRLTPAMLHAVLDSGDAQVIDRFLARRKLWGQLERPDAVAAMLQRRIPYLTDLTITVVTVGLAPGEDTFSSSVRRYEYPNND